MTGLAAETTMGWDGRSRRNTRPRPRLRHLLPPIIAMLLLALANLAFGAAQPVAALALSAAVSIAAAFALGGAGPRSITQGMSAGVGLFALVAAVEVFGPFHASGHASGAPLAVLFASGCMWTIGHIAARRYRALDAAWSTLIWTSTAYCAWMFLNSASAHAAEGGRLVATAFDTPANASLLFGLFALVATARVLHVLKQADSEGLAGLRLLDRMLRNGLGGFLLLGLSTCCLILVGSQPGLLMTLGVVVAYVWWDTLQIVSRHEQANLARIAILAGPLLALMLACLGVAAGWLHDETIAPGIGLSEQLPNLQRFDAYSAAWQQSPLLGHGLGASAMEGAAAQTLDNAKVMLAPGGAHNVFVTWLVEVGLVGFVVLVAILVIMHVHVFTTFTSLRAPRTFARTALLASALMLLHGVTDSSLNLATATWLYAFLLGAACGIAAPERKPEGRVDPPA